MIHRLAGLLQFVRDGIGIEDVGAVFAQHGNYGAFPACDIAGQADQVIVWVTQGGHRRAPVRHTLA